MTNRVYPDQLASDLDLHCSAGPGLTDAYTRVKKIIRILGLFQKLLWQQFCMFEILAFTQYLTLILHKIIPVLCLFRGCTKLVISAEMQTAAEYMSRIIRKLTFGHVSTSSENLPSDMRAQCWFRLTSILAQSDQSLCCPHEVTLHPWPSKMHPVKILIRAQLFKANDVVS